VPVADGSSANAERLACARIFFSSFLTMNVKESWYSEMSMSIAVKNFTNPFKCIGFY
jgi:hypothetical protein